MEIVEVQSNSYTQQVYDYIVIKIYNGEYPAGMRLKDVHLSKEIGVSTTPVREAIRQLEKDYWVTIVPYSGAFVKELGSSELSYLYDIRSVLEGLAARQAIANLNHEILRQFSAILDEEYKFVQNSNAIFKSIPYGEMPDLRFHRLIVETSKNERLTQLVLTCELQARAIPSVYGFLHDVESVKKTHSEHRDILKALRDRDEDMAEKLIKEHILASKEEALNKLIKNGAFDKDEDKAKVEETAKV